MGRTKRAPRAGVLWAVLAAALYALSAPLSKLLLEDVSPTMMASLLYLGAGLGMFLLGLVREALGRGGRECRLTRRDLPYAVGMILLDVAAPVLLMLGLSRTTPANAALLNNFEIVATSLVALLLFHEAIRPRLWAAITLITLSSILLSFEGDGSLQFSSGSLLVLLACVCWGFENNCTRMMSRSDPLEIVVIKGFGSGLCSLLLSRAAGEPVPDAALVPAVLLLGFVAYGLSIFFYVHAQRRLGAAKTSAYYAAAPFLSAALSLALFRTRPGPAFFAALTVMAAGTWLASCPDQAG